MELRVRLFNSLVLILGLAVSSIVFDSWSRPYRTRKGYTRVDAVNETCSWARGDGRCNTDGDCCPGQRCDSFGWCVHRSARDCDTCPAAD